MSSVNQSIGKLIPFPLNSRKFTYCDYCGRRMKLSHHDGEPNYCDYTCGANAQPDHTIASMLKGDNTV